VQELQLVLHASVQTEVQTSVHPKVQSIWQVL
jgi:hypothetical protein